MAFEQNFTRSVPARSCEACGSDHQRRHWRRGRVCGNCGALWPVFQVSP